MTGPAFRALPAVAGATMIAAAMLAGTARPAAAGGPQGLCAAEIARVERAEAIPAHLLGAIARVESGRWNRADGAIFAWPWTVTAQGRGRYLPDKQAAIAEVRRLRADGIANIDVGCMQINLLHHPDAFADLDTAFDPAANVAYAGRFLTELRRELRSWARAVARYHSATPELYRGYRDRVFAAWRDERRRARLADRAARAAARIVVSSP
ncbi:MAG TPA: transglycosylase SLT domain-containing protein [Dongiaceae bacterium]|nr:transglycosylase SLT domain-containing protein [Dongiaceae bacterium]